MQASRILTKLGSLGKKSQQWIKTASNKLQNLLVLFIPQSFFFNTFFHIFEFSAEIAQSESIVLTACFDTLIFKFSRSKMNFGIVFENFSADRWYKLSQKHQGRLLMKYSSINTLLKLRNSQKNGKFDRKRIF